MVKKYGILKSSYVSSCCELASTNEGPFRGLRVACSKMYVLAAKTVVLSGLLFAASKLLLDLLEGGQKVRI